MEIDLRDLDYIKGLLEIINDELTKNPKQYAKLIYLLQEYMDERK